MEDIHRMGMRLASHDVKYLRSGPGALHSVCAIANGRTSAARGLFVPMHVS